MPAYLCTVIFRDSSDIKAPDAHRGQVDDGLRVVATRLVDEADTPIAAAEQCWTSCQNLDTTPHGWRFPDPSERSMQCGDWVLAQPQRAPESDPWGSQGVLLECTSRGFRGLALPAFVLFSVGDDQRQTVRAFGDLSDAGQLRDWSLREGYRPYRRAADHSQSDSPTVELISWPWWENGGVHINVRMPDDPTTLRTVDDPQLVLQVLPLDAPAERRG